MQISAEDGMVYAMSKCEAQGEEIEIVTTVLPTRRYYSVLVWNTKEDECRWVRDYQDIAGAVEEYNRWAAVKETVPSHLQS